MLKKIILCGIILLIAGVGIQYLLRKSDSVSSLKGEISVIADLSKMRDTAGTFVCVFGGNIVYPKKKNDRLYVSHYLAEPRNSSLLFYPKDTINKYPGKSLNEIPVKISDYFYFLGQPGPVLLIVPDSVSNTQISNPNAYQKQYEDLAKKEKAFEKKFEKTQMALISKIKSASDFNSKTKFISQYSKNHTIAYQAFYKSSVLGFIRENPDSPTALYRLEEYSNYNFSDSKTITELYDGLSKRIKVLPTSKRIFNIIDQDKFSRSSLIGKPAPDFQQNNTEGKLVSLRSFRGHVILLEFWASWCGPCRVSNPDLVSIFQKYHKKGFAIISVSLDSNKQAWLDAIKNDNLTWTHLSDLKSFENSIGKEYHVNAIPSNFLIDRNGKIIASDLNREGLNKHLFKILSTK